MFSYSHPAMSGRVLIVDDHLLMKRTIRSLLCSHSIPLGINIRLQRTNRRETSPSFTKISLRNYQGD